MISRVIATCVLVASAARAQIVPPPPVPRGADPKDWEAHFDAGIKALERRDATAAYASLTYSSRLRPDRAEPLYARWVAFWARDIEKFADYLRGESKVLRDPQVIRADSLRFAALDRNPFVHQGLIVYLYDRLPGRFQQDQVTMAWIALGQAQLPLALERFGRAINSDPKKLGHLHFVRASAFANSSKFDSAAAEISTLLAQLRAEDEKVTGGAYQSKEMLEYALGLVHLQLRRNAQGKEAFGRSIVENAAFAPAHAMLGKLALTARDTTTALAEYGLAVETSPGDPYLRVEYGQALMAARRPRDAVAQYTKAIELEPLYAEPYFLRGGALEATGDAAAAKESYAHFLERAPGSDPRRGEARAKL